MAFDDATRGPLLRLVTQARSLLVDEFTKQFQQHYGHVLQRPNEGSRRGVVLSGQRRDKRVMRLRTARRSCVPAW